MKSIIDLTYPIEEGMTTFGAPWHAQVSITQLGRLGHEGRETRKITLGTHTGTQVDAPLHFIKGGMTIDQIPLEQLVGKVSIFDFSFLKPHDCITSAMLETLTLTKKIIFKFGWGKYWGSRAFYQGWPYFHESAAHYLLKHQVELIGFDTPSPDDSRIQLSGEILGSDQDSPIHKIFLKENVLLVEYLANLDKVDQYEGWNIAAMPLKIKGADGSPARVILFQ